MHTPIPSLPFPTSVVIPDEESMQTMIDRQLNFNTASDSCSLLLKPVNVILADPSVLLPPFYIGESFGNGEVCSVKGGLSMKMMSWE